MKHRQIIAIGGRAFSGTNEEPLLERYILRQARKKYPKVLFVSTATGDSKDSIINFYATFGRLHCFVAHMPLFNPPLADLRSLLLKQDVIFIGGGNTKNMLALWRAWGIDTILREAWEKGIVLCGSSAGSICWFEEGVTDSIPGKLTAMKCLGLLRGSNCPHYDSEKNRRPSFHRLLKQGKITSGLAADDTVALHYRGVSLYKVVSSRPQSRAYRVTLKGSKIVEQTIKPVYLER